MFALNEKVVYPGHGVASISGIIQKVVGGSVTSFFELTFYNKEMTILVPMDSSMAVGLRRLSSQESVGTALKILADPAKISYENSSSNWNRRNKDYQCKLRSGNLYDICKIYRDLKHISSKKELSFGEKNLLSKTELLIAEEISIVNDVQEDKAIKQLRSLFL
ncbi:CarD family transcriptional regulator [Candidatus Dependentiae bacterium]